MLYQRGAWSCLLAVIAGGWLGVAISAESGPKDVQKVRFHIAQQPIGDALTEFGEQSGLAIAIPAGLAHDVTAQPINGQYTPDEALQQLLSPIGLQAEYIDKTTITVRLAPVYEETSSDSTNRTANTSTSLDANTIPLSATPLAAQSDTDQQSYSSKTSKPADHLQEVVVTGTNIKGDINDSTSPVQVFTRESIEQTGAGTVAQFMETQSQNFTDISAISGTALAGGRANTLNNRVGVESIDLRGLGPESTLVLVDGQRIAPGGYLGNITDISTIPLAAIDRIEILTDGASAVYGSDAVGGVVNFITRADLSGSETQARYAAVTDGGFTQSTIGETVGHVWDTGSALLSYEYFNETPLDARDRSFSETAVPPFVLLPEATRHSLFATIRQKLTPDITIFADGTYAHKSTYTDFATATTNTRYSGATEPYSADAGININLPREAYVEVSSAYSSGGAHYKQFANQGQLTADVDGRPTTLSTDAKLSGPLLTIPSGQLMYAIGGQYRRETLDLTDAVHANSNLNIHRNVSAGFLELRIPVLGKRSETSPSTLEVDVADRYERYSDFGSTNNPKVGLSWIPIRGLTLRGSYGTSFRAPALDDLDGTPTEVVSLPLADPVGGGSSCKPFSASNNCTNTLLVFGGNGALNPEKAKTWTTGLTFQPSELPALKLNGTYYSIRYDDRITNPGVLANTLTFLLNEAVLGPSIVQRNPPSGLIPQLIANARSSYLNPVNLSPAAIRALVDGRLHNISSVRTDGVDFDLSYARPFTHGTVEGGVEGTKILRFASQVTPTSQPVDVVDTPYNPNGLRVRGRGILTGHNASLALFINFTSAYSNNLGPSPAHVSSWTTVDATFTYKFDWTSVLLRDISLAAGVRNIANRDPPFLKNPNYPVNFDPTNANPLGRFVYFQVTKGL
jgi:iron complex outermembrane recepter protein